ncbi:MAG: aldo/keto reductase, partial [Alphaproteobacteria bacterium]|nr:aldo/keto reductase [Alphaproteobacteria bacterium]
PVSLQPQYNLLVRDIEREVVPAALDASIGLLPWSPLGGGWLSGKYKRDQMPTGATRLGEDPKRGMEAFEKRNAKSVTWDVIGAVEDLAKARGASMAQVALAWVAQQPAVTSVILGARTTAQLKDNLGAADLVLTADEVTQLSAVSKPEMSDYPYGTGGIGQRNRNIGGGR